MDPERAAEEAYPNKFAAQDGAHDAAAPPANFPENLPPRPFRGEQRSGMRNCLTLRFLRSYSLRHIDGRARGRRIAMIFTVLFALASVILDLIVITFESIPGVVVCAIIDTLLLWSLAWTLAVIGDAVGTRRVLGINFGRKFFDAWLYTLPILYCAFFVLPFFVITGWNWFQGIWVGLILITFVIGWIASEPPHFPEGRV